jgi:UDP-N-acetylglucosamine 1-carboxyvinyltransferase
LHQTWVTTKDMWGDTLRVYRATSLKAVNIQTNIFPGFPTDLLPLFNVLLTQCEGTSRIHEILYEGRLNSLVEYERIGGKTRIINLHEAKIIWPTPLVWSTVNSWDLRFWAAMVIAGLIATWETKVENIYWIKRWYDNMLWKLQGLWADIQEIKGED